MNTPSNDVNDVHVNMWHHYDNLRQKKHATFLTANTILVAIAGFRDQAASSLVSTIAPIGIVLGIAWFLMLTRNSAYIDYHRRRVGQEWRPQSWTPPSSLLDRTLPATFLVIWVVVLIQQ